MNTVLYARYSTEQQSAASIEDQFRICRDRARSEGWTVIASYGDDATSGSTALASRKAGKELAAAIVAGRFDALVIESLDRLSRDQVEQETWVRRMEHRGIRIVGISDGYDSQHASRKLTRGMRGIINELYLDDLRFKTHRGQVGRVLQGFVAGGKSYGYRIVRPNEDAPSSGSTFEIIEEEASWVRFIFERYGAGDSARAIAYELNRRAVESPRKSSWGASALYGSPLKGSGILNNVLYSGRYVWNRSQWVQDPDTKKRIRIDRPRDEWMFREVPELRIVSKQAWDAVRARIDHGRDEEGTRKPSRRPASTLFSGIIRCPHCSGPLTTVDAVAYGCGRAKERGPTVCRGFRIPRKLVDHALTAFLREDFLSSEAADEFARLLADALQQLEADDDVMANIDEGRLEKLEAEISRLIEAIAAVGHSEALLARLKKAEQDAANLRITAPKPRCVTPIKVDVRAILQEKLARLEVELAKDAQAARKLIAELTGDIPIELRGDEIWARLATDRLMQLAAGKSSDNVVAGTGFEPVTFGL